MWNKSHSTPDSQMALCNLCHKCTNVDVNGLTLSLDRTWSEVHSLKTLVGTHFIDINVPLLKF